MKNVIKKHKNRNRYLLTKSGYWVRDLNQSCYPIDINTFTKSNEYQNLINNEMSVLATHIPEIGSEHMPNKPKVLIVSDGYDFNKKKELLYELPQDVCIIGVNRSLAKWDLFNGAVKRRMDFYLANNPYVDCMKYLPIHAYRPKCICSSRIYPEFVKKYKGMLFYYVPTESSSFGRRQHGVRPIDDYRNPICAAISIAFKFNVSKLALFCCDDSFADERPGAEKLPNGLWMYPQHDITHELVDGMFYWMRQQDDNQLEIVDHSKNRDYSNASYIDEEDLLEFFK